MADFNFGDGLRKVFLAGVGALATTVEKSQEIVDDLVKKGELTVEQGKALNAELKHKVEEAKEAPEVQGSSPGRNRRQGRVAPVFRIAVCRACERPDGDLLCPRDAGETFVWHRGLSSRFPNRLRAVTCL